MIWRTAWPGDPSVPREATAERGWDPRPADPHEPSPPRWMRKSKLGTTRKTGGWLRKGPVIEGDRKCPARPRNDANDPSATLGLIRVGGRSGAILTYSPVAKC